MADDEKVGYGRPPKASRFKQGRSGNPKGRPKGSRDLKTDLREALLAPVRFVENGKPRTITAQSAAIKRLVERAVAKGDLKAIEKMLTFARDLEADRPSAPPPLSVDDQSLIAAALKRRKGRE